MPENGRLIPNKYKRCLPITLFWCCIFVSCNTMNSNTSLIPKREAVLSHNEEPEEFTVIEMDTPTVFIKTGDDITAIIETDRIDSLYLDLESSDYLIFGKINFFGETNERRDSIVYRKRDRRFFNFHADGGNGNLLYVINYKTRTFDFFEITDNGAKIDIASVPIPNDSDYWFAINDTLLVSEFPRANRKEIYRLDGISLEKHATYPSNLWIMGGSGFAYYYANQYGRDRYTIIINLSNLKEIRIENGNLIQSSKESLFFEDGNRLGRYDKSTGIYSLMEDIVFDEYTRDGYTFSDFCIRGYNEYPINLIYRFKNNQLLFNSRNKICMYDIDTDLLYILFDYNIYPDSKSMSYLYLINDNYFYSTIIGASDLVSLDDTKIIYRFLLNWIDREELISDIAYIKYYETREGDIIIYQTYGTNFKDE